MEYRKATLKDIPYLTSLMLELGYRHTNESLSKNFTSVERNGGSVFVATIDEEVVGCICAIIDSRLAAGECGELVSLVVSSQHQGKKIGTGLVKYAESWLASKTDNILVRANIIREEAHLFYKRLGYTEEKSQKLFNKNL